MKTEARIQQEIFQYYWNNYCLPKHRYREFIFHVPNENQHKLTNIGVVSGVADLVLSFKGEVIFVEVKDDKGRQSPKQLKFQEQVTQAGFNYAIVRSLIQFVDLINKTEAQHEKLKHNK